MNSALQTAIDRVLQGPKGPKIGAFFDFDGTLIDGYSAAAYLTDRIRRGEMGRKQLVDTFKLARKKDLTDDEFATVIRDGILEWAGQTEEDMRALWRRLWLAKIGSTLFPEGWKLVQAHQRMGHTVAIASSATRYQIEPLAEEYGIQHILCTQAKLRNGKLTGGIVGAPAWGEGKAAAVRQFAREQRIKLDQSYGYANGNEDIAFLRSVGHATAVQPKELLEQTANDAGWPVLRFDKRLRGPVKAMARTVGAYGAMGLTFLAGLGYARATGDTRKAVDLITSMSSDAAFKVLGVKAEVIGEEHLRDHRPCVFIINHQSKFDMFLMMHLVRRGFTGVAKAEARKVPGFGRFMEMAEVAFLDRSNSQKAVDALKPAVDRLKSGLSVCIAPEGTRSWTPKLGPFKKGPFHLAMQAGVPIVPVVIRNAGEIMGRNDQTMRSGTIQVAVLPPVDVSAWKVSEMAERIDEVRQRYVQTLENWPDKKSKEAS
ncbi:HAD-IB family hydrolase [Panacagrimonas sp.]|uniref:HAD-IB family hydrolase n=1 Tax=Panacagrimonas sp. TaxID=2480088 RepID=UPI003B51E69F